MVNFIIHTYIPMAAGETHSDVPHPPKVRELRFLLKVREQSRVENNVFLLLRNGTEYSHQLQIHPSAEYSGFA